MLSATCHCRAVRVEIPRAPAQLTDCNCSICRRYGVLWSYFPQREVRVVAEPGATHAYTWGRNEIRFVRCSTCGCVTHWQLAIPVDDPNMGVNARNLPLEVWSAIPVEKLDLASDWKGLEHLQAKYG
jgi:hypothetical protein